MPLMVLRFPTLEPFCGCGGSAKSAPVGGAVKAIQLPSSFSTSRLVKLCETGSFHDLNGQRFAIRQKLNPFSPEFKTTSGLRHWQGGNLPNLSWTARLYFAAFPGSNMEVSHRIHVRHIYLHLDDVYATYRWICHICILWAWKYLKYSQTCWTACVACREAIRNGVALHPEWFESKKISRTAFKGGKLACILLNGNGNRYS